MNIAKFLRAPALKNICERLPLMAQQIMKEKINKKKLGLPKRLTHFNMKGYNLFSVL